MAHDRHPRAGQALIESCLVIGLICLLLAAVFQLAHLVVAQDYAAARGARARAVGFNDFMVAKTVRIGALGNAGALRVPPPPGGGPWAQWQACELPRIPHYLQAEPWMLESILDYDGWDDITWHGPAGPGPLTEMHVAQRVPLLFFSNVFRAVFAGSAVPMAGSAAIDTHYPEYLE